MTTIELRHDLKVELIQHMGSDEMVARAARVSTGKDLIEPKAIEGLINYLVSANHTSTLEHCVVTIRVEAPISVAREWMRHRTESFNEISGRYSVLPAQNYSPGKDRPLFNSGSSARPDLVAHENQLELWAEMTERREKLWQSVRDQYEWEIEQGIANEVARDNTLVSQFTVFYATANLNNWFKFLYLRNGDEGHPQWEIMQAAQQLQREIIEELFPITAAAWKKGRGK